MLTRLSKNVVCVKDIPSNLIEEAFFILKDTNEMGDSKGDNKREKIAMIEINDMVDEYTRKIKSENEKQKISRIKLKNKLMKIQPISPSC